ncbi:TPA: phage tail protein [Bacillus cereus biovar anthracis]|nr:phage tail protein [Bacillus cereus biovar anthracis]
MDVFLYPSNATTFNNLGLGVITGVESCFVTEELNGQYELELELSRCGDSLLEVIPKEDQIILAKSSDIDSGQAFRVYDVDKEDDYSILVRARHVSFDAKYYYVTSAAKSEMSARAAMELIMTNLEPKSHPFSMSTDIETTSNFESMFKNFDEKIQGTRGSLLDVYGGELSRDNWNIRFNKRRGEDTDIIISVGKNLTGLSVKVNTDDVYTRIVPFAKKNEDSNEDESYIYLPERFIDSPFINDYPKPRIKAVEIEDVKNESQLRNKAKGYFKRNKTDIPKVNAKIEFIPLWQFNGYEDFKGIERLQLGDKITARHPDITADLSARVIKTVYDSINERYQSIEVGDASPTMTSTDKKNFDEVIERIDSERSNWRKVVDIVTDKITGNDGGHVVLHPRLNPQEIFIMDTDDVNTSKQVLRMNKNGIGFSKTGINGPFETAWTVDGVFIADFIKSGTLDTSLLKTGVIKGVSGNMVIDLSNDMLDIRNGAISITRPDGYKVINNGMANFDLTVSEATPPWTDLGVISDGSWWTTVNSDMKSTQLYSLRHQSRYFKLHLGVAVEGGGRGKIEVVDMMGRVMAKHEFTNGLEDHDAQSGITLTIDLGKPDGGLKSYLLKVARTNGSGENRALVRKVICWLEG